MEAVTNPTPTTGAGPTAAPNKKREINRPKVGVVDVPRISSTPMKDVLTIKKQEHPKPKIEPPKQSKKNLHFNGVISGIIGACGIASIISLIKNR